MKIKLFVLSLIGGIVLMGAGTLVALSQHGKFVADHITDMDFQKNVSSAKAFEVKVDSFVDTDININVLDGGGDTIHVSYIGKIDKRTTISVDEVDDLVKVDLVTSRKWWDDIFALDYDFVYYKMAKLEISLPGNYSNDLIITNGSNNITMGSINAKKVTVKNSSGSININRLNCQDLDIKNSSGNITLEKINASNINIKNSSGSIKLSDVVSASNITIANSSGGIRLTEVGCQVADIKNSSGSINVINEKASIDKIDARTNSGSLNLHGKYNEITVKNSSGRIEMKLTTAPSKIHATNSSGSINLYLNGTYSVYAKTSSGKVKIDSALKNVTLSTDVEHPYYLKTSSANINIRPL